MDGRQEILDVFDGCPGDCPAPPAIFTQTGTVGQMAECGASWPEANFDLDAMVTLALQPSRMFGFCTARVPYCLTVEPERLGAVLNPGRGDTQPSVVGSPYRTPEGYSSPPDDLMSPEEYVSGGRCAVVAEAAGRISREHPDLFVTAGMLDPMGLAMHLIGTESALIGYIMDPSGLSAWVERMVPYSRAYAARLSEEADNVLIIGSSSTDLLAPDMVTDLCHPALRETLSAARGSFTTVHVCGSTMDVIDGLKSVGADGLSLEASHDPSMFLSAVGGRTLMFGSVDPIGTLLSGTPGRVVEDARAYSELGFDIITPECGVPPYTPNANLAALAHYRDGMGS